MGALQRLLAAAATALVAPAAASVAASDAASAACAGGAPRPCALAPSYTVALAAHLETPPREGLAWSHGGAWRVQFASPGGPPADPAYGGPAAPERPTWNIGLQLPHARQQCAWWEWRDAPGEAQQCVCWPIASAAPPPLPDWVSFAAFPVGTAVHGEHVTYNGKDCTVWRVPIAGDYDYWYYYEDNLELLPVAFDTRQMLIDITSYNRSAAPPAAILEVPEGCSAVRPPPIAPAPPPPPARPPPTPVSDAGCIAGPLPTDGSTATYSCFNKTWAVSVPPQCASHECGLVVDIHGWNMDGEMQDKNTQMRARGAEDSFVTLQPTACCGEAPATSWTPYNDSALQVKLVVDEIVALLKLDTGRLHVTGFSQGGCMTWQLLSMYSTFWASVAPTACGQVASVDGSAPVPVLYQQGTHDGLVPIEYGRAAVAQLRTKWNLTEETLVAKGSSYNYTRFTAPAASTSAAATPAAGMAVEFITHEYTGVPVGPLAIWGHCFAGSSDVPGKMALVQGQIMNFGCPYDPASPPGAAEYTYSTAVAAFFRRHTKAKQQQQDKQQELQEEEEEKEKEKDGPEVQEHEASAAALPCGGTTTTTDVLHGRNLSGVGALVTGGASGLGYATALALVKAGCEVIIADDGWNVTAGELAAREINSASGTGGKGGSAQFMPLDLSSFTSVRSLASEVVRSKMGDKLLIVVNNAAGGSTSLDTPDGFNERFTIDYLGPFLLTELLLPTLRKNARAAASAAATARKMRRGVGDGALLEAVARPAARAVVVNVASDVHLHACETAGWTPECFATTKYLPLPSLPPTNVTVHYPASHYTDIETNSLYGACKLLQIQHAAELAKREAAAAASPAEQVWAFSVHPGSCGSCCSEPTPGGGGSAGAKPQGWHNMSRSTWDHICDVTYKQQAPYPCPFSAAQGAAVYLYAALDAPISGVYHSRVTVSRTTYYNASLL